MKSELLSWPVTMAILVIAFGSLVAAGLPLMLTILGLGASAGMLFLLAQAFDISIWAMNFALMFALALGIDYALFIVSRFRGALFGSEPRDRRCGGGDHGHRRQGRALLGRDRAHLALGGHARTQPRLSLDGARDHALRGVRARRDADPAAGGTGASWGETWTVFRCLGSTPASTGRLPSLAGPIGSGRTLCAGESRPSRCSCCWSIPVVLGLDTGMPSIKVVPESASSRAGVRLGAAGLRARRARDAPGRRALGPARRRRWRPSRQTPASPASSPPRAQPEGLALIQAVPADDPSEPRSRADDRPPARVRCLQSVVVGGAAAENHDLESALGSRTALVIGGRPRARVPVAPARAPGAGDRGRRRRHEPARDRRPRSASPSSSSRTGNLSGLLGFESQGFLNAWGPVFFFAMIFAISMDYTVFLLSSAKEHYDRSQRSARGGDRRHGPLRTGDLRRRAR